MPATEYENSLVGPGCSVTEPARKAASATWSDATDSTAAASGHQGQQITTGWAILAYNADTLAIRAA